MTGEKNRYSSLEKLWKLDDETLKTSKHDEMILYLFNKNNIKTIFPEIIQYLKEKKEKTYYLNRGDGFTTLEDFWERVKIGDSISIIDAKKVIEGRRGYLYTNNTEEIIDEWGGIIDEYRSIILPEREIAIRSEVPIITKKDFLVGYWDIVITLKEPYWQGYYFGKTWKDAEIKTWNEEPPLIYPPPKFHSRYFIEVKPKINSFGATLRQLRTYQQYEPNSVDNTYLFTSDLRFKDAFECQGIPVIPPNGNGGCK